MRDRNFGLELGSVGLVVGTWASPRAGGMNAFGSPECPERREFAGSPMAGKWIGGLCTGCLEAMTAAG
jgi:hypothetical protein